MYHQLCCALVYGEVHCCCDELREKLWPQEAIHAQGLFLSSEFIVAVWLVTFARSLEKHSKYALKSENILSKIFVVILSKIFVVATVMPLIHYMQVDCCSPQEP